MKATCEILDTHCLYTIRTGNYFILRIFPSLELTTKQSYDLDIRQHFCVMQVMEHWHGLPRGCGVSSMEILRSCLDVVLGILLWVSLLGQEIGPSSPCQTQPFCGSLIQGALSARQELGETWKQNKRYSILLDFRVTKLCWERAVHIHIGQYLTSIH